MDDRSPVPADRGTPSAPDRDAATARLNDLFGGGLVSMEEFYAALEQIFAASSRTELEATMRSLPPPVQLTPASLRLAQPLALRFADGGTRLGSGWQLGAATSVTTGSGATWLDLNAASWDALEVDLHLETWGSIVVLVPRGVAVQMLGGSGRVRIEPLAPPYPGGPVLRVRASGPTGVICVRHLEERRDGSFMRHRRRSAA